MPLIDENSTQTERNKTITTDFFSAASFHIDYLFSVSRSHILYLNTVILWIFVDFPCLFG